MRYALLIHDDEEAWGALPPDELAARMQEYQKFSNGLIERGLMRGGEQLRPSLSATTVRMSEGKVLTLDGPFCEA